HELRGNLWKAVHCSGCPAIDDRKVLALDVAESTKFRAERFVALARAGSKMHVPNSPHLPRLKRDDPGWRSKQCTADDEKLPASHLTHVPSLKYVPESLRLNSLPTRNPPPLGCDLFTFPSAASDRVRRIE